MQSLFTIGITKLFMAVGAFNVENFCAGFMYECDIPEELKK
ncbi:cyclic lactone autoinducer peptide [Enterococcus termitis]|jgi:cyclic lactone autoinducer peptide|nr:hypothetical protein RV18_GL000993 [Enterococcus termitis]